MIRFSNSYAKLPGAFYTRQDPTPVKEPRLLAYNDALAAELGIDIPEDERAGIFAGNDIPLGAAPLAQLYAGHQFGHFNPQLGDGRAILLGELNDTNDIQRDIQLKGSGRTPYSRGGDGRAWMGPVLREYVISEAMHALGIPTTRALAAVATGEPIFREAGALPGAILTRVATSHLRVGTFQIFAHRGQIDNLRTLTDYAIARHYPDADGPMGLLRAVCAAQANLIPAWMSVGFIHGVMNTDNCAISGETIDYGPCAFMDGFAMDRVFSSIDRQGRYAYANQPRIVVWNMAQLATALIQQCEDKEAAAKEATEIVHGMPTLIEAAWLNRFAAKIGISAPSEADRALIDDLLTLMQTEGADFTNVFRALSHDKAHEQFVDQTAFADWSARHHDRIKGDANAPLLMQKSNPAVIPRNHRIEQMIDAAVAGDLAPFERLVTALATPFDSTDNALERAPTKDEIVRATYCGT